MQRHFVTQGAVWLFVYLLFVLAPLFALLAGTFPPARSFWSELSVALGYSGLAMMGLQFGLTARFRHVTRPWGEDVIYHFHQQISLVALALILLHPIILFVAQPGRLSMLNFFQASWRIRLGAASLYLVIILVVTSLWRAKFRIPYGVWHVSHIALALAAIAAGLLHMLGFGRFLVDPWKQALWIGLVGFWILLLLYVRVFKPLFMLRRPYRVTEVRQERGDTWTLAMQPEGHPGLRFSPGQFAWLTVWGSPFKITGHPFSFSSSAATADRQVELSIRNLGDFTSAIPDVPVGKRVYLDGPYGAFTVGEPGHTLVLIAGGIGITPMMSMIRTFADRGDDRPVILFYANRNWDSVTFREELETLKDRLNLTLVHVLQDPPPGWTGEQGYINEEMLRRHLPQPYSDHEYFICGPDAMMDAVENTLKGLDVPISNYHSERYSFA